MKFVDFDMTRMRFHNVMLTVAVKTTHVYGHIHPDLTFRSYVVASDRTYWAQPDSWLGVNSLKNIDEDSGRICLCQTNSPMSNNSRAHYNNSRSTCQQLQVFSIVQLTISHLFHLQFWYQCTIIELNETYDVIICLNMIKTAPDLQSYHPWWFLSEVS